MTDDWAVVGYGDGGFSIRRIDISEPGANEVQVAMRASGVCRTDWDNLVFTGRKPRIVGHEGAGVITAIGDGVRDLTVGQRVLLTWAIACRQCFQCRLGNEPLCESLGLHRGSASSGITRDTAGTIAERFLNLGTMSTTTVVRREAIIPIPDDVPFASAALLGCAVMTGYGSVMNAARVESGSSVAVIGCGGVGLNAIQGARFAGARRIVAIDVDQARKDLAEELGATDFVVVSRDDHGLLMAAAEVAALLGGRGADYAFECTGVPYLAIAPLSFVRNGGTAVQVSGVEQVIPVDMELFEWNKTYLNPLYGNVRPDRDFPILFDHYRNGHLKLDQLITSSYSLREIDQAFSDLTDGRNAKGVILFE